MKHIIPNFFFAISIIVILSSCSINNTNVDDSNIPNFSTLETNQSNSEITSSLTNPEISGKIVFQFENSGRNDIGLFDLKTSELKLLTFAGDNLEPSFSSDGKMVIYSCKNDGEEVYQLCIYNLELNTNELFYENDSDKWGSQWSPDNKSIIFVSNEVPYAHLHIINFETKIKNDLALNLESNQSSPKWGGDNDTIFYVDDINGFNIYKMNLNSNTSEKLTNFNLDDRPDISTIKNGIVFRRLYKNSSFFDGNEIFLFDLKTKSEVNLTNDEIGQDWPIFSPSGNFLLITFKIDTKSVLRILELDTLNLYSITDGDLHGSAGDWTE